MNWRTVLTCLAALTFLAAAPNWVSANPLPSGEQSLVPLKANQHQIQQEDQQKNNQEKPKEKVKRDSAGNNNPRINNQNQKVVKKERVKTDQPKRQENPRRDLGKIVVKSDDTHKESRNVKTRHVDPPNHDTNKIVVKKDEHTNQTRRADNHRVENPRDKSSNHKIDWKDRSDHWNKHWPDQRGWEQNFHDWGWHSRFQVDNVHAYYSDREHNRVVYMNFEPEHSYFDEMNAHYGRYNYEERLYRWGGYGTCYHWFRNQEVYSVFVRDDGYMRSFIWHRHETDEEALALGLLNLALLSSLNQYDDDMPQDLAALYVANVLWNMAADD